MCRKKQPREVEVLDKLDIAIAKDKPFVVAIGGDIKSIAINGTVEQMKELITILNNKING